MVEKIGLWTGFCIAVYQVNKKKKGYSLMVTTSKGDPRENPAEAWVDALRMEAEFQIEKLKKHTVLSELQAGICPSQYAP